jgi:hypothetical protein
MWFYRFILLKPGTPGARFGEKWPENGRNVGQKIKIYPNKKLCLKLKKHHVRVIDAYMLPRHRTWPIARGRAPHTFASGLRVADLVAVS